MADEKPRFDTKAACEAAIKSNPRFNGCSPMYVPDRYASAHGLERGGWYLYSRNNLPHCVK